MFAKRDIICPACIVVLCCACFAHGAGEKAPEKEWKKIKIGDQVGYVMPPEVVRELGLPWEEISEEQNAATYYIRAINAMAPLNEALRDVSDEEYQEALKGLWGPNKTEFHAWFQKTAEVRRLLRKAIATRRCQFPHIGGCPGDRLLAGMLLVHLARMRNFARLLVIEGHLYEKEGKLKEALDAYLHVLRLGGHAAQEPNLISGLVGIACQRIGQGAIRDCLERRTLSDAVLEWLGKELAEAEGYQPDRRRWIIGERAMARQILDMGTLQSYALASGEQPPSSKAFAAFTESRACRILWPDRTMRKDFDNFYNAIDQLAQRPTWEAMAASKEAQGEPFFQEHVKDWNVLAWLLLPALDRAQNEYVRLACHNDALRINVALRRYHLKHGKYAEKLSQLVPGYIEKLPVDPFSGKPFHYRRERDGWLLYSVGLDLDDDGGKEAKPGVEEGDMVFRSVSREKKK